MQLSVTTYVILEPLGARHSGRTGLTRRLGGWLRSFVAPFKQRLQRRELGEGRVRINLDGP
jgi:hypothetical protein